ncbi:hypothetical protein ACUZX0_01295 [Serratia marcescens]|uniref:hypothetical protein n=1 Tax=Serratia marcescens TaxID=615 RepID=UPI0040586056
MTTIKRFTPDYKIHAVRFEAFAREAEHGEYVRFDVHQQVVSALEAERDALAVERDAARNALASIYKTVTGELPEWINWHAYLDDIVEEVGAAVAAIQAQGVEKLIKLKMEQLASMHPDTHAFGATAESQRAQINELQAFAANIREAK